jgi:cellulose synthase/poly-beta-1,6-N-acetylglucosamine synthase-like glycosyltransferase
VTDTHPSASSTSYERGSSRRGEIDLTSAMTEQPLVSICITSHNYARFLPAALESALGQSYPNVEIVVVDDGSIDGSHELLERYADSLRLELQPIRGQAAACNRCFELSRGDIVLFHDSDDVLEGDAAERIVAAFEDPRVVLVLGRLRDIDERGEPLPGVRPPEGCTMTQGDLRRMVAKHATFTWPETTGQSFRRTVLDKVMPIPDGFAPDLYLSNLVALDGYVATIERPVGRYRVHGGNKHMVPGRAGVDWLDMKLRERRLIDREVHEKASDLGLTQSSGSSDKADPSGEPHDYIRAGLELARRRVTGERGGTAWALEGIRAIVSHPQFRIRARARHVAWFAAAAAAPPRLARRVVEARYPFVKAPA